MATSNGMMHIGELAERSEMSLRSLRHYDEIGLLSASGRTEGGFRLYTETDYERLILIRRMKPLGFSLDEMADLLRIIDALESGSDENRRAELRAELSGFVEQTITRREKLRRQLEMADEFLELLRTR
ncbi:MerR family transcriptional regulator [Frigoribacterium sp. CFBP9030]|uniref:MerR family transcriptional regulator n=1 Tax=Frigoribacterium sp. CFBP9030 TaxID=3096537 RepID=UPI002A6B6862|nr:MerR family transcriptional regulator [Frigoribacterium sp. CFBP9030]MDY0892476.1 MerR family transcriptional regulator [Frigoribacterium sp. CFBP9030]